MGQHRHMSLWGAGPLYVITISVFTLVAACFHFSGRLPSVELPAGIMKLMDMIGIVLAVAGITVWSRAVYGSGIRKGIREDRLVTDGIYAWIRHPVYASFTYLYWGILFCMGNVWLLVSVPLYWIFLTVLMKNTEEKWLHNRYGKEYEDYCRKVNRCIPKLTGKK